MPAIRLYKRMGFKPTGQPSDLLDKPGIQFLRAFDSDLIDDDELKRNAVTVKGPERLRDHVPVAIRYRGQGSPAVA